MAIPRVSPFVLWFIVPGLVLAALSQSAAGGEPPPPRATVTVRAIAAPPEQATTGDYRIEASGPNQAFAYTTLTPSAGVAGTYLIGVQLSRTPAALAAQLGLGEGKGLVVDVVVPGTPADKAGVKQHDVLVSLADVQVSEIKDVAAAVDKAKGKEIQVLLIRQGKKQTVRLTPARQTIAQPLTARVVATPQEKQIVLFQPYVAAPGVPAEFPKDLKVVISKQGSAPAEIVVTRGDKTWKVTDQTLGELPEEVRKPVQQFLSRTPQKISLRAIAGSNSLQAEEIRFLGGVPAVVPAPQGVVRSRTVTVQADSADPLTKRLDEIAKRLDAIEKALKDKR